MSTLDIQLIIFVLYSVQCALNAKWFNVNQMVSQPSDLRGNHETIIYLLPNTDLPRPCSLLQHI
jgi:hypothetical protein